MNPLTGIAMQWTVQSFDTNQSDASQMMQHNHASVVEELCNTGSNCEELCNSAQHCSNTLVSLLSGFSLKFDAEAGRSFLSGTQALHFSLLQYELFRPPRA